MNTTCLCAWQNRGLMMTVLPPPGLVYPTESEFITRLREMEKNPEGSTIPLIPSSPQELEDMFRLCCHKPLKVPRQVKNHEHGRRQICVMTIDVFLVTGAARPPGQQDPPQPLLQRMCVLSAHLQPLHSCGYYGANYGCFWCLCAYMCVCVCLF